MKANKNIVELKFFDFDIQHQEITDLLDLSPTVIWVKGEEYTFGNPKNKIFEKRKENYWEYSTTLETGDWIGDQIDGFISDIIIPRQDQIKYLAKKYHSELSVVQYMYDGVNPGYYFDRNIIKVLNYTGLELNIDVYVLTEDDS